MSLASDSTPAAIAVERPSERPRRVGQWILPLVVAGLLVLGSMLMLRGAAWVPTGDLALLQLRLEAMPQNPPEVGVYSRLGWFHPGPAFLWLMWAGYTVLGGTSAALVVTIAVVHAVLLVLAWWLVRRFSPDAAVWILAAGVAVLWARSSDFVLSPWNPYVGIVGVLALIGAGMALANRDRWAAFMVLPLASLLVQSHVGYAPVAVIITATAVLLALFTIRATPDGRAPKLPWLPLLGGVVVSVVMWWPPLVEQLTGDPGNLRSIIGGVSGAPTLSLTEAMDLVLAAFTLPPQWSPALGGLLSSADGTPWLLALPVAATLVALLRRRGVQVRALLVAWAGLGAAAISAANIQPPAFEYLLPWLATVAAALLAVSVWVLMGLLGQPRVVTILLGAAVVVLTLAVALRWAADEPVLAERGRAAEFLTDAMLTDAAGAPVAVAADPQAPDAAARDNASGVAAGMALLAVQSGADVAVDEQTAGFLDGVVAVAAPDRLSFEVRVVTADTRQTGADTVAVYDPFTTEQWEELAVLDEQLRVADLDPLTRLALAQERNGITEGQTAYALERVSEISD